nr:LytTR family DNA-binding domain-containing protein [Rhodoferax sp.]
MKAIIVDDERLARMEMRRLLAAHADVEIVGEAADVASAKAMIEDLNPDLVFLDIQMPDGTGFDVLGQLADAPDVIFTTAFDSYAMQAFEANALDYLLKPIEHTRLASALQKIKPQPEAQERPMQRDSKIFIKDGERCWFVKLDAITLCESEGNYTRVYFDGNRPLLLRSLNQLEQRLDPSLFFRASRRHIVNLDHVANVTPSSTGALTLQMNDGLLIEMSRRRAAEFKQLMHL